MSHGFIYRAVEKCEEIGAKKKIQGKLIYMPGETNGAGTAVRVASS